MKISILAFSAAFLLLAPSIRAQNLPHPLKVCILQDKSGSSPAYGTPQLQPHHLEGLIDLLAENGGEVSVGIIDESSNWPLTRLFIPEQPQKPAKPDGSGGARQTEKDLKVYRLLMLRYLKERKAREEQIPDRVKHFNAEAAEHLNRPANAMGSDIWGAVFRCEQMLAEPDDEWETPPIKIMALISDAEHNRREEPEVDVPLPSGAEVLIVNGRRTKGRLGKLNPVVFESFPSAFRYISTKTQK